MADTKRYYDLGMVETQQTDLPEAIPTAESMADLMDRIKDMSKTRPLQQIYETVACKGKIESWESLSFGFRCSTSSRKATWG